MTNVKPTDKSLEFKVRTRGKLTDHDVGTATLPLDQGFDGWLPLIEGTGELNVRIEIPTPQTK
jgi:hypothetical protein